MDMVEKNRFDVVFSRVEDRKIEGFMIMVFSLVGGLSMLEVFLGRKS